MSNNEAVEIATISVANYLLMRLEELGLDSVFQVPGDYVQEFMNALEEYPNIQPVGDIDELGAAYAADAYARLTGIGAISVQYGVGTFSALNAVAGSYVERNPVVVITASPSAADRQIAKDKGVLFHHSTGKLNADQTVFKNVTVAAEIISDTRFAPEQIDSALVAAITHKRPIYIEAYQNVWGEYCPPPQGQLAPLETVTNITFLEDALALALRKIEHAQQPIIMLGIEIARFGLETAAQALLDKSGIPYTTTTLAKSVLDENNAQFLGTYAGPASSIATNQYVIEADCIIALGCIFTDDYLDMMANQYEQMIEVNIEHTRVDSSQFSGINLGTFITSLSELMGQDSAYPRTFNGTPNLSANTAIKTGVLNEELSYTRFFDTFSTFFHDNNRFDDIHLILGESSSLYTASNLTGLPKDCFIANAAWGSLGHETGAATGVAFASDKRPIVVAGDGGFMMMCQALSTISRNQLNAVVFVMSNQVYAIEQAFVSLAAFEPDGEFAPFDILPTWDYLSLAQAFGVSGFKVSTVAELQEVLTQLDQQQDTAALVEVVIPEKDLAPQIRRLAEPS